VSKFLVDSRTLLAVRDTLGRLHDQLLGMHTVIFGYWGMLGGSDLEGELEHFCGTWHYGVTEIAGQVSEMMQRLTGAAAAYERIEQRITKAGSGTTVIGGPPPKHTTPAKSGSGTTVIGGAPPRHAGSGSGGGSHSGSGTTVIGGGGSGGSGGGSGTTVIGGGGSGGSGGSKGGSSGSKGGSGTTVVDTKRAPSASSFGSVPIGYRWAD
jgi:hypothetical protein